MTRPPRPSDPGFPLLLAFVAAIALVLLWVVLMAKVVNP